MASITLPLGVVLTIPGLQLLPGCYQPATGEVDAARALVGHQVLILRPAGQTHVSHPVGLVLVGDVDVVAHDAIAKDLRNVAASTKTGVAHVPMILMRVTH